MELMDEHHPASVPDERGHDENPMSLPAVVSLLMTISAAWTLVFGVGAVIGFAVVTLFCFTLGLWWRAQSGREDQADDR